MHPIAPLALLLLEDDYIADPFYRTVLLVFVFTGIFLLFACVFLLRLQSAKKRMRIVKLRIPISDDQVLLHKARESSKFAGFQAEPGAPGSIILRPPGWRATMGLKPITIDRTGPDAAVATGPAVIISKMSPHFPGSSYLPSAATKSWTDKLLLIAFILLVADVIAGYAVGRFAPKVPLSTRDSSQGGDKVYIKPGSNMFSSAILTPAEAASGKEVEIVSPVNSKKLTIKVPAGVRNGTQLRLRGEGYPGKPGEPAGDLLVQIVVQ